MSQAGILDFEQAFPQIPTNFVADAGNAIPIANTLEILGGTNINTSAAGNTVDVNLDTTLSGLVQVDIGNIRIAGNTISTTNVNGDLILSLNGAGRVYIPTAPINTIPIVGIGGLLDYIGPLGNGQLIIGNGITGIPNITTLKSIGGTITITNGAGTINLEVVPAIALQITAEDATTCNAIGNNVNIIGTATNGINTTAAIDTLTISMASPYANGDFVFQNTVAATPRAVEILNSDNDPGSYSSSYITATAGGGDAFTLWRIAPATRYFAMGIDNSDNDYFKFTHNVDPSSGNTIFMVNPAADTFTHYYANILQTKTLIAGGINTIIQNTDNTNVASDAFLRLDVGGASAGDPSVHFLVTGAGQYCMGIDNTVAGDPFKITDNASPSAGTVLFAMTSTGVITLNNDLDVTEGGTGVSTFTSHGILYGNGAGDIQVTAELSDGQVLIGDTAGVPIPANLSAGVGIAIVNGAGTITVSAVGGGLTWTETTVNAGIVVGNGYIANKAGLLTMTLPAAAVVGDTFRITGMNTAVGWRVAQNALQQIYIGTLSTTIGIGGYIEATQIRDSVELVCVVAGASTRWNTVSFTGNITVV